LIHATLTEHWRTDAEFDGLGDTVEEQTDKEQGKGLNTGTKVLIGVTAVGALLFVLSLVTIWSFVSGTEDYTVTEHSVLYVPLVGALSDAPVQPGIFDEPDGVNTTPSAYARGIRRAAEDERIDSLFLEIDGLSAGWAITEELRSAVLAFRATGKPCVVWSEFYDTTDYYLASACDTVLIAPAGFAMINGVSISLNYYADLFKKLGVEAEFAHVGDFKSAIEPYTRMAPSAPAAEAYELLVENLYQHLVEGIVQGRGMTPEAITAALNAPSMSPEGSIALGLIDGVAFKDTLYARIRGAGEDDFVSSLVTLLTEDEFANEEEIYTNIETYLAEEADLNQSRDRIAIIYAEGQIVSGAPNNSPFSQNTNLTDVELEDWVFEVMNDETVQAVVLRVNSPGGSGLASDMMLRSLETLQESGVPLVVSMGNYAASGGYYISAKADWIVAQPSTLTGSIGVFGGKFNVRGAFDKLGVGYHEFFKGDTAADFSLSQGFSEAGMVAFQAHMDSFYQTFIGHVAEGRGMSLESVNAVGQGRVWTGSQALENGLVDALGGIDVALAKAASLADLDDYSVEYYPRQRSFMDLLLEEFDGGSVDLGFSATKGLSEVDALLQELLWLDRALENSPVMLMLPGGLKIVDGASL
jgi:protease-4